MKTADEIASAIVTESRSKKWRTLEEAEDYAITKLTKALTDFAEARVKEAIDLPAHCHRPDCALEARNSALEEAAKLMEVDNLKIRATQIRALKTEKL